jgi:hypothetical protein
MRVLPCTQTAFFDVDDTLVMWSPPDPSDPDAIEIVCPTSRTYKGLLELMEDGELEAAEGVLEPVEVGAWTTRIKPHKKHIEQFYLPH